MDAASGELRGWPPLAPPKNPVQVAFRQMNRRRLPSIVVALAATLAVAACDASAVESPETTAVAAAGSLPPTTSTTTSTTTTTTTATTTTTTTTLPPVYDLSGTVVAPDGSSLADTTVTIGEETTTTDTAGMFSFAAIPPGEVTASRLGWLPTVVDWEGETEQIDMTLEPRIVRGLRVSSYVAADRAQFDALLDLAANSTINTLVFDSKDESSAVLYESASAFAAELGSIDPMYDPVELIAAAEDQGFYTITRIVTFEDRLWARQRPDHKLAGAWIDPTNEEAWEYPLQLAVEACELGFDEIQFDYVRFPAGQTAIAAQRKRPLTEEERVAAIGAFLTEAKARLHPLGCPLSADIFAIVLSSSSDEGIGQRPEDVSAIVDAVSPMIYPSHYSDGWLGFSQPNDHPGPVVADALDDGIPRMASGAQMRPWLQAFYYNGSQVLAEIAEAEQRGTGWILWNAGGNYAESWLPPAEEEQ